MHNTHHTFLYITQVGTLLYHYIIFVIYQSMNVYNIHALMEMEHPENFIPIRPIRCCLGSGNGSRRL